MVRAVARHALAAEGDWLWGKATPELGGIKGCRGFHFEQWDPMYSRRFADVATGKRTRA